MVMHDAIAAPPVLERRLPRSLTSLEVSGFGLTGHLAWISTAPLMQIALGPQAILVWIPAVIVGMMLNFQVKRLGTLWPDVAGGTPSYITRLLQRYPGVGRYAAMAYFFSWAIVPALNAILLTDLLKASLAPVGIVCPELPFKLGFMLVPFVVAFSGTRTLGILHSFFILPAVGFMLVFCMQGLGWLTLAPTSPGLLPTEWGTVHFVDWAKWFFFAVYGTYACETSSSFVADSQKPNETLRFLKFSAWLIPIIYLGGSWVLMQLDTASPDDPNTFVHLRAIAQHFWGSSASLLVTLFLTSSCLLNSSTAVSNSPRILYQLALDRQLAPVFAVVSRQGVLAPSLLLTLMVSLVFLEWGDSGRIVVVASTAYLVPMMAIHGGLWLRRGQPEALWPWWSLGFLIMEVLVLLVGGLAWSWQDVGIGLLAAPVILGLDAILRRLRFPLCRPEWWLQTRRSRLLESKFQDFVAVQVIVLIILVCSTTTIGWTLSKLGRGAAGLSNDVLITLLMIIAFVAIAIACWTSLPQVAAIAAAREHAENLFITALDTVPDTILVLSESGTIIQANPAATSLLCPQQRSLIGQLLSNFFPTLLGPPHNWAQCGELTLRPDDHTPRIIEVTLSPRSRRNLPEYIVILRDITERKQADTDLREALRLKEALAITAIQQAEQLTQTLQNLKQTQSQLIQTEKMSSLGQMVAGVAHEINNPVNFIHGNLSHVQTYTQDLLKLVELYQTVFPQIPPLVEDRLDEIDLDFLRQDLPKTLQSMKIGADRIRQIVLTLRNFSRLDEAEMKPVDIHEGIDSTLLILQNRLKPKADQAEIQVIKQYGDLPVVECYAGQLNQVFMNLISNAIDALVQRNEERTQGINHPPSRITISTQFCETNAIRIGIRDNGGGIPEAVQTRIFDPFFTTKPVGQGTGLGLSISYQIVVNKHGGTLTCVSAPHQGTEFWMQIPIQRQGTIENLISPVNLHRPVKEPVAF